MFEDSDIAYLLGSLGRNHETPEVLQFLDSNKGKSDIYDEFCNFLEDQINESENNYLYEKVKGSPFAISLFEQTKEYLGGKIKHYPEIYSGDFANQLFWVGYFVKKPEADLGLPAQTLQQYHDVRISEDESNTLKYMRNDLLKYYNNIHNTQEGKKLRDTANKITEEIGSISKQELTELNKNQLIYLYNSMMIFIYGNNKK